MAGKAMVDSGAKTMLKTDVVFLEREIKNRKQKFGLEMYDLMEALEDDTSLSVEEKEGRIRLAFDITRRDVAATKVKINLKYEEMATMEADTSASLTKRSPLSAEGSAYDDSMASEGSDAEYGHRPY
eukprot:CAMPEP_0194278474 /NCGR_PEP_ID=MMETSP0169-20130528/11319_1 /TAXON_ID=218684 /ORGANISM="Corethron pennatum, Strain L29A3" /LENGTH=126 /DNA_ID=CAMNT_0039022673 /DNA_START=196 /DNA_END=576 /DNA_ORIENTATION=-